MLLRPACHALTGLLLVCTCALSAQVNVDSLKHVLARTHRPLERLEVLRQLSKAYDLDVAATYALATIHYADSLLEQGSANDSTVGSQRGNGLWNYGVQLIRRGSSDQARSWYEQAIVQWEAVNDMEGVVFGNSQLAAYAVAEGRPLEALSTLRKNLAFHQERGDKAGMARDRFQIGSCLHSIGEQATALDHYLQALDDAQRNGVPELVPAILGSIGMLYGEQGQQDTAIAYYERAVQASSRSPYRGAHVSPTCNIAGFLLSRGEPTRALRIVQKALEELGSGEFHDERTVLHRQLGIIYRELGDLESAVKEGERSIQYNANVSSKGLAWVELGHTWLRRDQPAKALACARAVRTLHATSSAPLVDRRECAKLFYEAFNRIGPTDSILFHYRHQQALSDSVDSHEIRMKMQSVALKQQELADSLSAAEQRHQDQLLHERELSSEQGRKRAFMLTGMAVLLVALGLWSRLRFTRRAKRAIEKEKDRSEGLLRNILPEDVAEELKAKGEADARLIDDVTILFTDFKGFTAISEQLTARELVDELNECFKAFDHIITARGIEKIKTIGDAYMCAGGLAGAKGSSPLQVVLAALEMQDYMVKRKAERALHGLPGFDMRLGIHTGPVVAGIVGVKKFQYDIWGDTVNIASRMESSGEIGQVNISEATYALVNNTLGLRFTPRGKVQAKGKGELEMYFVSRACERV